MSQISINFDTKEKTLSCKVDGVEMPSVCGVYFHKFKDYNDHEMVNMRIEMMTEDEENGLCYHNVMCASELEAKTRGLTPIPGSDGLYIEKSSSKDFVNDANKMMGRV